MYHLETAALDDIYNFALGLGKEAGDLLQKAANDRIDGCNQSKATPSAKASEVDIVTQTDNGELDFLKDIFPQLTQASQDLEKFIKDKITERFPEHKYV